MRILVDVTHPAHVQFFRNAIDLWRAHEHQLLITSRQKDITTQLLDEYGYEHTCLTRARRGVVGLMLELLEHEAKLLWLARRFKADLLVEIGGTFIVHAAKLLKAAAVVFYDTENARISNAITYPFADVICTPSCYQGNLGRKHVRYKGYQELAYLHPNRFKPDRDVLPQLGLSEDEPFALMRFVGWASSHDVGLRGFSLAGKRALIGRLEKFGRVLITSESPLPSDLERYRISVSPTRIHDLMSFARLYIGESATMASESALLGTPAIYVSPIGRGYTEELEHQYALIRHFHSENEDLAINTAAKWLASRDVKKEWRAKRDFMLKEKIDVTRWMVEFVEGYPHSASGKR